MKRFDKRKKKMIMIVLVCALVLVVITASVIVGVVLNKKNAGKKKAGVEPFDEKGVSQPTGITVPKLSTKEIDNWSRMIKEAPKLLTLDEIATTPVPELREFYEKYSCYLDKCMELMNLIYPTVESKTENAYSAIYAKIDNSASLYGNAIVQLDTHLAKPYKPDFDAYFNLESIKYDEQQKKLAKLKADVQLSSAALNETDDPDVKENIREKRALYRRKEKAALAVEGILKSNSVIKMVMGEKNTPIQERIFKIKKAFLIKAHAISEVSADPAIKIGRMAVERMAQERIELEQNAALEILCTQIDPNAVTDLFLAKDILNSNALEDKLVQYHTLRSYFDNYEAKIGELVKNKSPVAHQITRMLIAAKDSLENLQASQWDVLCNTARVAFVEKQMEVYEKTGKEDAIFKLNIVDREQVIERLEKYKDSLIVQGQELTETFDTDMNSFSKLSKNFLVILLETKAGIAELIGLLNDDTSGEIKKFNTAYETIQDNVVNTRRLYEAPRLLRSVIANNRMKKSRAKQLTYFSEHCLRRLGFYEEKMSKALSFYQTLQDGRSNMLGRIQKLEKEFHELESNFDASLKQDTLPQFIAENENNLVELKKTLTDISGDISKMLSEIRGYKKSTYLLGWFLDYQYTQGQKLQKVAHSFIRQYLIPKVKTVNLQTGPMPKELKTFKIQYDEKSEVLRYDDDAKPEAVGELLREKRTETDALKGDVIKFNRRASISESSTKHSSEEE